jgi:seryl-tRNA(Sec) selenium transferase
VHIRWERELNRLRLYGPSEKLDAIQASIQAYLQQSKQQSVTKAIALPAQVYKHMLRQGKEALQALQQQSAADSIGLDVVGRQLQVTGRAEAVAAAEAAALALLAACEGAAGVAAACSSKGSLSHGEAPGMQQDHSLECPVCR